jgi:succinate dehydrogenase / fumarate reductase cytochrome b subunit
MQSFINSSVGKKILMAVSGQLMLLFVIIHVIGNSTIYFGLLNDYAEHLHSLYVLVWTNRVLMFTVLTIHVYFGIQLTLENWRSKPEAYAVKKNLRATRASKNMIWTGLVIGAFLIYHLLHFTFQVTNPEIAASVNFDSMGRPDVTGMVLSSFKDLVVSLIYVVAMGALLLHLTHGIQSSFQTLGLNNERTIPVIARTGSLMAYVLFIGFVSIPIIILFGLMKG